jgi:Na+/proline symporter
MLAMQNEPDFIPPPPPAPDHEWVLGIGLLLLLHLIQIPLAVMSVGVSLVAIGLSQLLYVIPAIIIYRRKNRPGMVKGLIIGAAITFLLNGACTALFFLNPPNFH